ncbi:hypothetical protein HDK77DRAFT_433276 [Phyllosticta capitalensis]|uniref:uncharacterized protein n=1 Tax=Phyllosticta capitalensis TaxID=121624 RepID=UPI0031309BEA
MLMSESRRVGALPLSRLTVWSWMTLPPAHATLSSIRRPALGALASCRRRPCRRIIMAVWSPWQSYAVIVASRKLFQFQQHFQKLERRAGGPTRRQSLDMAPVCSQHRA